MRYVIAFSSPAGSTRKIGWAIKETLEELGRDFILTDLGRERNSLATIQNFTGGDPFCLFIGTPVLRDLAAAPVMSLIGSLNPTPQSFAVPYCTWGGVASGIALYQMAQALLDKGFLVPAAARVISSHSIMRNVDNPLGDGHPNEEDEGAVKGMARLVVEAIDSGDRRSLDLQALDYPNPELAAEMKKKLSAPMPVTPKTLDKELCTLCGVCASECPAGAIVLDPEPRFGGSCFDCLNCFCLCPEKAIKLPVSLEKMIEMIRNRSKTFNESPRTVVLSMLKRDAEPI